MIAYQKSNWARIIIRKLKARQQKKNCWSLPRLPFKFSIIILKTYFTVLSSKSIFFTFKEIFRAFFNQYFCNLQQFFFNIRNFIYVLVLMNTWQILGNLFTQEKIPNFNLIFFKHTKAYQIKYSFLTYHDNNSHFWLVLSSLTAVRFCDVIESNPGWISPAWIIRQNYGILFRNEAEISVSLYSGSATDRECHARVGPILKLARHLKNKQTLY